MRSRSVRWATALALALPLAGCRDDGNETETIEHTLYTPPGLPDDGLEDDRREAKGTPFDPDRVDPRPHGEYQLNLSDSVLKLDIPMLRPDADAELIILRPSYASAIAAVKDSSSTSSWMRVLPSVNMIDGKAKQFDDGVYAAIDQAYYQGSVATLASHVGLIRRLLDRVGPESPAAPFLAAGLELAGQSAQVKATEEKDRWLLTFRSDELRSKPIGFYTWNRTLSDAFRFLRYFQQPFGVRDLKIPRALARALGEDPALQADYRRALDFYARLTNPDAEGSVASLIGHEETPPPGTTVAFFPSSTSRETELFAKLFPNGLPPDADLMRALVTRIRSGAVDLRPSPNGGWYDHQVYALETLLLPEKGEEQARLLLTKTYKRRMLDAFQALMTKRRETHLRGLKSASAPEPMASLAPRLRLEPCPSYYLRTARSYTFLARFLDGSVGEPALKSLHGLREGGERAADLHAELASMRELFYGLYLVSAEDIGMKPDPLESDEIDPSRCQKAAIGWLEQAGTDPDLAADTRVSVPIYNDPGRGVTRLWATIGVRLAKLDASYDRGPKHRPANGSGEWKSVESYKLDSATYLIPVDEFAEVELKGLRVLSRPELRKACDTGKTKAAIIAALEK